VGYSEFWHGGDREPEEVCFLLRKFYMLTPRTLPIAALAGIGIAATVYILINIAYFSVLTVDEFLSTEAVAVVSFNA